MFESLKKLVMQSFFGKNFGEYNPRATYRGFKKLQASFFMALERRELKENMILGTSKEVPTE